MFTLSLGSFNANYEFQFPNNINLSMKEHRKNMSQINLLMKEHVLNKPINERTCPQKT